MIITALEHRHIPVQDFPITTLQTLTFVRGTFLKDGLKQTLHSTEFINFSFKMTIQWIGAKISSSLVFVVINPLRFQMQLKYSLTRGNFRQIRTLENRNPPSKCS